MRAKPCTLIMNSPLNGYIFTPIECESISEALKIATAWECPFRIYDMDNKLIKSGWRK